MRHGNTTSRFLSIRAKMASRHWARSRPKDENPYGVPGSVMKQLASESLPDKEAYQARLQELMAEQENANG